MAKKYFTAIQHYFNQHSITRMQREESIKNNVAATGEQPGDKLFRFGCFAFAALLTVAALYCRIRLLSVPLERDEGGFAYVAQQLLNGIPPYISGNMKVLTGIHFAYAVIMALFGESSAGIHSGLLVVNVASMVLLYLLARRILPVEGASITVGIFAFLSVTPPVLGVFAHATNFVVLFVLAGLVTMMAGVARNRLSLILASGVCFGLSVLMKQHGVFFCLFAFGYLFRELYRQKQSTKSTFRHLLMLVFGMLVPYAATCVYMVANGVFDEFWFWTVTRSLDYATEIPLSVGQYRLKSYFESVPQNVLLFWYMAGIGLIALIRRGCRIHHRWFTVFFLFTSIVAILPGLTFYSHYFVLLLPAISILAGIAFVALTQITVSGPALPGRRPALLALMLLLAFYGIYQQRDYLFILNPTAVSRSIYGRNPFPESIEIARYIRENSTPDTQIAILGSEPQIYFYADRSSATDYLYMYPLVEQQPHVEQMQDEMIREIELACPEFIVLVWIPSSWLYQEAAGKRIITWGNDYLSRNYHKVGIIDLWSDGLTDSYWGKDAEKREVSSQMFIVLFQRND